MTVGRQIADPVRLHRNVTRRQANRPGVLTLVGVAATGGAAERLRRGSCGGLPPKGDRRHRAQRCNPKVLIADDDGPRRDRGSILDLIDNLRSRLNMAVILVTAHDLSVIAASDRVMVVCPAKY